MSTALVVSGANYPSKHRDQPTVPLEGRSLLPLFAAAAPIAAPPRVFTWEQYGYKAVRLGDLKAVFAPPGQYDRRGRGQWELYDLSRDRTETHDLAATHLAELQKLVAHWDAWAARAQVFPVPAPTSTGKKKAP
jgi:arylsulfatase